jgi:hypothetical protein
MHYNLNSNQQIQIKSICDELLDECLRARAKHPPFHSTHEAYAVILEELEEWWDSVKADRPDDKEILSVAAMAVLTIVELQGKCVNE